MLVIDVTASIILHIRNVGECVKVDILLHGSHMNAY